MDWQETVSFFAECMPRSMARMLAAQKENSVREIRVRAGGQASILTWDGEKASFPDDLNREGELAIQPGSSTPEK